MTKTAGLGRLRAAKRLTALRRGLGALYANTPDIGGESRQVRRPTERVARKAERAREKIAARKAQHNAKKAASRRGAA